METSQGYEDYYQQMEAGMQELEKNQREISKAQLSMYGNQTEDNLVKWQLNLEEEKMRIFHLLKGERLVIDNKGNEYYAPPEDKDSVIFNDYGVDYIMGLLESFLNRNIILSNFSEDRIMKICLDLANQITDDIFCDYERMGLDTEDKINRFQIIVMEIVFNIEAAFNRAYRGGERESLRKIMSVNQTEPLIRQQNYPIVNQPRQPSKLNPLNWFRT